MSPVFFNLASEKIVRILQENEWDQLINQKNVRHFGFIVDLDIICESLADVANAAIVLEESEKIIGLIINTEKTKIKELIDRGKYHIEMDIYDNLFNIYDNFSDFEYLRATLRTNNDWSKEISSNK